ncbi:MAG: histidinol phosphate phosphatase domain-containing protein [Oligoflexia bacterium]|nr:histidinol phosphate phosphatase domain-containing protein [Oligoflexia bacterium]
MIDLHTHTRLSDGEFTIAEHLRRAETAGYDFVAVTDHVDQSNVESVVGKVIVGCDSFNKNSTHMKALPGIEITHVHPSEIVHIVKYARSNGIKIVAVHGETIVESVFPGTNHAAIMANVDFLGHPGIISEEDVLLAKERNVRLEITCRKGHALGNGRVFSLSKKYGTKLLLNSDTHAANDFYTEDRYRKTALGAGLSEEEFIHLLEDIREFVKSKIK